MHDNAGDNGGVTELANLLWGEREILRQVIFKVIVEQLVSRSSWDKWLPSAHDEVEATLGELRTIEVIRAAQADALAIDLGLPAGAGLAQVADAAGGPWVEILRDHREAMQRLVTELEDAVTPRGSGTESREPPPLAADQATVHTPASVRQASLLEFLA